MTGVNAIYTFSVSLAASLTMNKKNDAPSKAHNFSDYNFYIKLGRHSDILDKGRFHSVYVAGFAARHLDELVA